MLRTIETSQLRSGMYVHRLVGPWFRHPFWRTSFLADADDVRRVVDSAIGQVVIDTERGADVAPDLAGTAVALPSASSTAAPRSAAPTVKADAPADLESEIVRARRICLEGRDAVGAMFREARLGRSVDPTAALPLLESITGSVMRNPVALVSVARLKTADDYTYLHSVAVSALMAMLSRQLGLSEEQTMEAALGGLLHDMGKAGTPLEILNKPGRLTDGEFAVMRRHPEEGERLLRAGGVENRGVLDIALHHHEKIDGGGYPQRLEGDRIPLLARMGAVCDVYDAITSNRPYKQGWDPGESLRRMASWKGHFDPPLFQAFVRSLGIYPLGTLVRLESGRLAVVVGQHSGSLLAPKVRAFHSARRREQILVQDIDLAAAGCQDRIVGIESPEAWGFRHLEKLWMP